MGNTQKNRKSIKDVYLKLIEKKKREYFKKKESAIFACDIRKWKEFVLDEILESVRMFPEAGWPRALEAACRSWKTVNDNKYRSNIVLFDYLQENKPSVSKSSRLRRTIIKVPDNLESDIIDFEASSIFDFLNSHFDQSTHFIAYMISIFKQQFFSQNSHILHTSPHEILTNSSFYGLTSQNLVKELKSFIIIALQTMVYYYGGLLARKMQENPNQMYDFILEKILTEEIHDLLMHAYNLSKPEEFIKYKEKVESYEDIMCSDLQISELFCIDKPNNFCLNGFEQAIGWVKNIKSSYTPLRKLEVISQATDLICSSVDDYWREDPSIDTEKLVIDGDNFLSIYIYIVIKSGVLDLMAHIWLILQFARRNVQHGATGYYLTTLEACLIQITSLDI